MPEACTHADRDAAETLRNPEGGAYQREERDSDSVKICREAEELYRRFTNLRFDSKEIYNTDWLNAKTL
jgi:hypothetical protein